MALLYKGSKTHGLLVEKSCTIYTCVMVLVCALTTSAYLHEYLLPDLVYLNWSRIRVFNTTFNNISVISWQS